MPNERPRRKYLAGQELTAHYTLGLASRTEHAADLSRSVQILAADGASSFHPGFCAYVFEASEVPGDIRRYIVSNDLPCIIGVDAAAEISSGDMLEINDRPGRMRIVQFADLGDYILPLTTRCNSNCLMCPDSEGSRRRGRDTPMEWVSRYLSLIPPDADHLTITGGEPTLLKHQLFAVLDMCRQAIPRAQFLLLSNARMFWYQEYAFHFVKHAGRELVLAAALHSADPKQHDQITRVTGSFEQTLRGIANLLGYGGRVEVRIVIQRLNCNNLLEMAKLIVGETPSVEQVTFMGLELLGNAAKSLESVWVNYREVGPELGRAIRYLVGHGIPSRIYNLPLCMVEPTYWSICAESIAGHKRTYKSTCAECDVMDHCGGLFGTPLNHKLIAVRPIEGRGNRP